MSSVFDILLSIAVTNSVTIANCFHNFFVSLGSALANSIPKCDSDSLSYLDEIFLHNAYSSLTESELSSVISQI